jgi:DNA-binding IscR family transcriptional regulator
MKMTVFWDIALSILVMMAAVSSSETSVSIYQKTRRNIPEQNYLQ